MSGMAEVLAAHQDAEAPNGGSLCICGEWQGPWTGAAFADHQSAALSAAGFGPVKEAGAVALEEAANDSTLRLSGHSGISITKLRARAAELRKP